jgi:hypothetical protein
MTSSENTLVSALGELTALGTERDREQAAAGIRAATAAEAAVKETQLTEREAAVRHVMGLLDQATTSR